MQFDKAPARGGLHHGVRRLPQQLAQGTVYQAPSCRRTACTTHLCLLRRRLERISPPSNSSTLPSRKAVLTTETCYITTAFAAVCEALSGIQPHSMKERSNSPWNRDWLLCRRSEQDMIENMEEVQKDPVLPISALYCGGYGQGAPGGGLVSYSFPNGLESYAAQVRSRGFIPGIWTSPIHAAAVQNGYPPQQLFGPGRIRRPCGGESTSL